MKRLFLFFFALGILFSADAQELGVKGGINLANIRSTFNGDGESGDLAFDFHLGGYAEFQIADQVSVQPELLYSREGAKYSGFESDLRLQVNVIQIPVLIKYSFAEGFNLHAGPQLGIVIANKFKADGNSAAIDEALFNTVIFGGAGGAGYDINENIEVGGRYTFGISDLYDDDSSDSKSVSNVVQLYISYKLR